MGFGASSTTVLVGASATTIAFGASSVIVSFGASRSAFTSGASSSLASSTGGLAYSLDGKSSLSYEVTCSAGS